MKRKKITKKERLVIYKEAKKNIADDSGPAFLCGQLSNLSASNLGYLSTHELIEYFPEFALFEPDLREEREYMVTKIGVWFKRKRTTYSYEGNRPFVDMEFDQMERMICLDMCILLLTDPLVND